MTRFFPGALMSVLCGKSSVASFRLKYSWSTRFQACHFPFNRSSYIRKPCSRASYAIHFLSSNEAQTNLL